MLKRNSISGFTLVEIAIVLVIIGMLIGLGSGMIAPLTKRAKYNETKDTINGAVEAVISFAAANNRITTTTEFTSAVRRPRDAWSKDLYYIPAVNLDDLNSGGVCGRKTTGITVRDCTNPGCTTFNTINNVAFAVISGAENYNVQTNNVAGTIIVYETDTAGIDNCTNANNCPSAAAAGQDPDRAENYDDIIKWITLDELRIKTGCTGPQLKILNSDLPSGYLNSAYSAVVSADGGVRFGGGGNYRWCRQESASTGLTFAPTTLSANCLALPEASWGQADSITVSGTAALSGNTTFTFFVRDNNDTAATNDNIAQKSFSLTISPPSWVSVRNTTGAGRYYRINSLLPCQTIANNANFSAGFTETITFFTTAARCTSNTVSCSQNYSPLKGADTDMDGIVRLSGITNTTCAITDF